jgi:HK97 family phage major capsid protein
LIGGQPDTFLGYPIYPDPNVASLASNARVVAFLDWVEYYVRHGGDPVIEMDTSYRFATDETAVRAKWRIDGEMIDLGAGASIVRNV